jgi:TolB protein
VSEQDGSPEIYTVSTNGKGLQRLTHNTVKDVQPVWSPDGAKIAFVSHLDGDAEIFVMDANGDNQTRLTNNNAQDTQPAW